MKIPTAAIATTHPATAPHAAAPAGRTGNSADSGFAQALRAANDNDASAPDASSSNAAQSKDTNAAAESSQNSTGENAGGSSSARAVQLLVAAGGADLSLAAFSNPAGPLNAPAGAPASRGGKSRQSTKEDKQENKDAVATAAAPALPQIEILPFRILPFSRQAGANEKASAPSSAIVASAVTIQTAIGVAAPPPRESATLADSGAPAPADAQQAAAGQNASRKPMATQESPDVKPQEAAPAPAGELAFAARVHPASEGSAAAPTARRETLQRDASTAPPPLKKSDNDESDGATPIPAVAAGNNASSLMTSYGYGHHAPAEAQASSPAPAAPAGPHAPTQAAEAKAPELIKAPAAPLKDLSVQVSQPGAEKVEVRIVQQGGELRMAVRTGDSELAHGLQQGLSDLVGRLQENGLRAEAWRPGGPSAPAGLTFEPRTSAGGSQNNDSQPNYGGSRQQQQGERRQNQSRPGWVAELEESIAGGKRS